MFGVAIDPVRPEEDLQIPEQMPDHEEDKHHSGRRHDHLSSDGRAMEGGDIGHKDNACRSETGWVKLGGVGVESRTG
jgi:hypothetical protein